MSVSRVRTSFESLNGNVKSWILVLKKMLMSDPMYKFDEVFFKHTQSHSQIFVLLNL